MIRLYALFMALLLSTSVVAVETIGVQIIVDQSLITTVRTEGYYREQMERWMFEYNQYLSDSNSNMKAELVYLGFWNITATGTISNADTILSNIRSQIGGFEGVEMNSDLYGADYTYAVVPYLVDFCGKAAAVNVTLDFTPQKLQRYDYFDNRTYAVSRFSCDSDTFAHELGHVMGLAHGNKVAQCYGNSAHMIGLTPYSRGYSNVNCDGMYQPGEFGTLMVQNYAVNSDGARIAPVFSNPGLLRSDCNNSACGDIYYADAARTLRENAATYANYESTDVDKLSYSGAKFYECIQSRYSGVEIDYLQSLNCSNLDISSLAGIEQLEALRMVDLSSNRINVVKPLELLDKAQVLNINLYGNNSAICSQLDSLEGTFPGKVVRPENCLNMGALVASLSLILN